MTVFRILFLFLLTALVGACGPFGGAQDRLTPPVGAPALPDTCGAGPYARLVGLDATALERELILRQVRVIRPGDAVTRDHRPARLNFEVDGAGRIARLYCG